MFLYFFKKKINVFSSALYFFIQTVCLKRSEAILTYLLKRNNHLTRASKPDNLVIDVLIPVGGKDVSLLSGCISGIRENVMHHINKIYVVGAHDAELIAKCTENGVVFIDEEKVLGGPASRYKCVVKNEERTGWLVQQLIKLSADKISQGEHILIVDADTILTAPQRFYSNGQYLMRCAFEYHRPYYKSYRNLMGVRKKSWVSFVAHHMLVNKSILSALKIHIEKYTSKPWDEAIYQEKSLGDPSFFSEYETYGNFLYSKYPQKVRRVHFENFAISRHLISQFIGSENLPISGLSVSLHSYL